MIGWMTLEAWNEPIEAQRGEDDSRRARLFAQRLFEALRHKIARYCASLRPETPLDSRSMAEEIHRVLRDAATLLQTLLENADAKALLDASDAASERSARGGAAT
eukprot:scaffold576_cov260-Pinguiococcus_pyrenoidosus.AAC.71